MYYICICNFSDRLQRQAMKKNDIWLWIIKQLAKDQIKQLQLHPVDQEMAAQPVICIMLQSEEFSSAAATKSLIIRQHSTINDQFLALRKHATTPNPKTNTVPAAIMLYVEACCVESRTAFVCA